MMLTYPIMVGEIHRTYSPPLTELTRLVHHQNFVKFSVDSALWRLMLFQYICICIFYTWTFSSKYDHLYGCFIWMHQIETGFERSQPCIKKFPQVSKFLVSMFLTQHFTSCVYQYSRCCTSYRSVGNCN